MVRALDAYRETKHRPPGLTGLCDRGIAALHALRRPDTAESLASAGLLATADEIATLASSLKRLCDPKSSAEANTAVERIQKNLGKIKDQKEFSGELRERIDYVLDFFQSVAEEGLANCRRQAAGETTEAERIWQQYSTT